MNCLQPQSDEFIKKATVEYKWVQISEQEKTLVSEQSSTGEIINTPEQGPKPLVIPKYEAELFEVYKFQLETLFDGKIYTDIVQTQIIPIDLFVAFDGGNKVNGFGNPLIMSIIL